MSELPWPGFDRQLILRRAIEVCAKQCEWLKCPGCPLCLTPIRSTTEPEDSMQPEDDMQPGDDGVGTTCKKRQKPEDDV